MTKRLRGGLLLCLALFCLALPRMLPAAFVVGGYRIDIGLHHATLVALFVAMAMGANLSIGFAGLLDLGFIAFVAVGAYAMAISLARGVADWLFVLPLAVLLATLTRFALGATCLRLRGDYLAIVTLGFGEIMRVALKNDAPADLVNFVRKATGEAIYAGEITGGPDGIFLAPKVLPRFVQVGPAPLYYLALALAFASVFSLYRLRASRVGRAWEAIREDEVAAAASGVPVFRARLWAYGLGGVYAGLAGALYALYNTTANPSDFEFLESAKVVTMVVLGGMGSIGGVAAGAVLFILLLEVFRDLAQYRMLIFGATLVGLMIWRPQGLAGRR